MKTLVFITCLVVAAFEFVSAGDFGQHCWNSIGVDRGLDTVGNATPTESLKAELFFKIYSMNHSKEKMLPGMVKAPTPTEIPPHKVLAIFALSFTGENYMELHTSFNGGQLTDNREPGFAFSDRTPQEQRAAAEELTMNIFIALGKFQDNHKEKLKGMECVHLVYELKKIITQDIPAPQGLHVVIYIIGYA